MLRNLLLDSWVGKLLIAAAILLSAAVFLRRGFAAGSAVHVAPGVAITSGCEEESFFAVWRAARGQIVYTSPYQAPYAAAYFNWLFYAVYAGPAKLALRHGDEATMILATRGLTALLTLAGAALAYCVFRQISGGPRLIALAVSLFAFFGPLVGWWAHTLRPDLAALVCELAGLSLFLLNYRHRPNLSVAGAACCFYAAWALKPSYITGLAAVSLFLLGQREWRRLLILCGGTVMLWALTLFLLGPVYRDIIVSTAGASTYDLQLGWSSLLDAAKKTAPLGAFALTLPFLRPIWPAREDISLPADARRLALPGMLAGFAIAFSGSCKLGAASYYFFPLLGMLLFLAASLPKQVLIRTAPWASIVMLLLQGALLSGLSGRTDLESQSSHLSQIWKSWQAQPEPRFSAELSLNLPWLHRQSPPLVLAYNYPGERAAGRPFAGDGVGGLIATGYFRTLLLPSHVQDQFDGGKLTLYRRGESLGEYTLFHRIQR